MVAGGGGQGRRENEQAKKTSLLFSGAKKPRDLVHSLRTLARDIASLLRVCREILGGTRRVRTAIAAQALLIIVIISLITCGSEWHAVLPLCMQ